LLRDPGTRRVGGAACASAALRFAERSTVRCRRSSQRCRRRWRRRRRSWRAISSGTASCWPAAAASCTRSPSGSMPRPGCRCTWPSHRLPAWRWARGTPSRSSTFSRGQGRQPGGRARDRAIAQCAAVDGDRVGARPRPHTRDRSNGTLQGRDRTIGALQGLPPPISTPCPAHPLGPPGLRSASRSRYRVKIECSRSSTPTTPRPGWGISVIRSEDDCVIAATTTSTPPSGPPTTGLTPVPPDSAVRSEWRLLAATHNLLKLHRHQLATA
jgi:hypothetical protein